MPPVEGTLLIDAVIVVTLLEWIALLVLWRLRGAGMPPPALARMLLPGLCLMLAVRGVMLAAPWYWMATLLSAAGLTHLIDLRARWRSRPRGHHGE